MQHAAALVATVSLGQPRRFLLKPAEGGPSIAVPLGRGDLYGRAYGRHGIPKVAKPARASLMFRPKWAKNYRTSVDDPSAP
jgi:hypothetical protein